MYRRYVEVRVGSSYGSTTALYEARGNSLRLVEHEDTHGLAGNRLALELEDVSVDVLEETLELALKGLECDTYDGCHLCLLSARVHWLTRDETRRMDQMRRDYR